MIEHDDDVLLSIKIIHKYWKLSPHLQMALLPKINHNMNLTALRDYLNKHLFESGLMDSSAYRAMYRMEDRDQFYTQSWNDRVMDAKDKLEEMFTGPEWRIPIIRQ